MPLDFDNVLNGPAQVLVDDVALGHTQGGASIQISPQTRMTMVDQFGSQECNVVDLGVTARATIPWAEWSDAVLEQFAPAGYDGTTYWGLGAEAGTILTAVDLKINPFLAANAAKRVQIYRAVPIGQFTVSYANQNQVIPEQQYACLVDEDAANDGDRVLRLQFGGSA